MVIGVLDDVNLVRKHWIEKLTCRIMKQDQQKQEPKTNREPIMTFSLVAGLAD